MHKSGCNRLSGKYNLGLNRGAIEATDLSGGGDRSKFNGGRCTMTEVIQAATMALAQMVA